MITDEMRQSWKEALLRYADQHFDTPEWREVAANATGFGRVARGKQSSVRLRYWLFEYPSDCRPDRLSDHVYFENYRFDRIADVASLILRQRKSGWYTASLGIESWLYEIDLFIFDDLWSRRRVLRKLRKRRKLWREKELLKKGMAI